MTSIKFSLLGAVRVTSDGTVVAVPAGKPRIILATLLLSLGDTVSLETIAEMLWGSARPRSERVTVQNHVMRLRRSLSATGRHLIITQPNGYRIDASASDLDVAEFEDLLRTAREAASGRDWDEAARLASAALSLWRGEPLVDVGSELLIRQAGPRLQEMRLVALETRISADLILGRHAEIITELQQLTDANPFREQLHAQLMSALYRGGRRNEALSAFLRARTLLREELGVEPSTQLCDLQQQILSGKPLQGEADRLPGTVAASRRTAVPRQLPGKARYFAGRHRELALLSELVIAGPDEMPLVAISGSAGVGKTALAIHWARTIGERFPDGQLYVDLRGFASSRFAVDPARAMGWLLDGLGAPPRDRPAELRAQAALYRSLLADRRVLIVLDNARDAAQVRPLLPSAPGCLVLVTSRNELTGLVTTEGAAPLALGLMSPAEAVELLATRLGAERVDQEPEATARLTEVCAGLPLALSIVAARCASRPWLPLSACIAELSHTSPLDLLRTSDSASDIRTIFSWSCQRLTQPAARLFRLLGVHCGPDISRRAVASLAGVPVIEADELLDELASATLIVEHQPGRFTCHDLLHAFAAEQAVKIEGKAGLHRAAERVLDHYLHTSSAAAALLYPASDPLPLSSPAAGAAPEPFDESGQALAWCQAEHKVLVAAVAQALALGLHRHAWQIPQAISAYLDFQGHWSDWAGTQHIALTAATRLGDLSAQARAHRSRGDALVRLGADADAEEHLTHALAAYGDLGDRAGQAKAHNDLAWVAWRQGRINDALAHGQQSLACYRTVGHRAGEIRALGQVGWYHTVNGDHEEAVACCREALALNGPAGFRHIEAEILDTLGVARSGLGQHAQAADCLERAIGLFRECGDLVAEAGSRDRLGDARHAAGDLGGAYDAWDKSLSMLEQLHDPGAAQLRAKLSNRLRNHTRYRACCNRPARAANSLAHSCTSSRRIAPDIGRSSANETTIPRIASRRLVDDHYFAETARHTGQSFLEHCRTAEYWAGFSRGPCAGGRPLPARPRAPGRACRAW